MSVPNDTPFAGSLDYSRLQTTIYNSIVRGGRPAVLRNNATSALRSCHVILMNWRVQELMGGLYDPLSRKGLFSPVELSTPPSHDKESLLVYSYPPTDPPTYLETLKMRQPATPFNQSGLAVYWFMPVWEVT